jgi:hypothetical protein
LVLILPGWQSSATGTWDAHSVVTADCAVAGLGGATGYAARCRTFFLPNSYFSSTGHSDVPWGYDAVRATSHANGRPSVSVRALACREGVYES